MIGLRYLKLYSFQESHALIDNRVQAVCVTAHAPEGQREPNEK